MESQVFGGLAFKGQQPMLQPPQRFRAPAIVVQPPVQVHSSNPPGVVPRNVLQQPPYVTHGMPQPHANVLNPMVGVYGVFDAACFLTSSVFSITVYTFLRDCWVTILLCSHLPTSLFLPFGIIQCNNHLWVMVQ